MAKEAVQAILQTEEVSGNLVNQAKEQARQLSMRREDQAESLREQLTAETEAKIQKILDEAGGTAAQAAEPIRTAAAQEVAKYQDVKPEVMTALVDHVVDMVIHYGDR